MRTIKEDVIPIAYGGTADMTDAVALKQQKPISQNNQGVALVGVIADKVSLGLCKDHIVGEKGATNSSASGNPKRR